MTEKAGVPFGGTKKPAPPPVTIIWQCHSCDSRNYAHHLSCSKCGEPAQSHSIA